MIFSTGIAPKTPKIEIIEAAQNLIIKPSEIQQFNSFLSQMNSLDRTQCAPPKQPKNNNFKRYLAKSNDLGQADYASITAPVRKIKSKNPHANVAVFKPVTVQTADSVRPAGHVIPSPPPKPVEGFTLDMSTIETKLAETAAVSAILNKIFKEDEPIQPSASNQTKSATTIPISGLDVNYRIVLT